MPIEPEDLIKAGPETIDAFPKRIEPAKHGGAQSRKFAAVAVATTLEVGTPVAFNDDLDAFTAWDPNTGNSGEADEVQTLAKTGTVSGGTYTITFAGQTTAAIAFDADDAAVQAALEALSNIAPGDVVVADTVGVPPMTITFGGAYADADVPLMEVDSSLLTGGGSYDITETTEGTAGTAPAGEIVGFVYPNPIELSLTGEVFGVVMMKGLIHRDDIVLPTVGSPTSAQLDAACRDGLLERGILVEHLDNVR